MADWPAIGTLPHAKDALGANAAGIRAIWLNAHSRDERKGPLQRTVHDPSQLGTAIAAFVGCMRPAS
jgi:FMN phosphatase YigB (HAD superfamily)